jgi:hypothetical protein
MPLQEVAHSRGRRFVGIRNVIRNPWTGKKLHIRVEQINAHAISHLKPGVRIKNPVVLVGCAGKISPDGAVNAFENRKPRSDDNVCVRAAGKQNKCEKR